MKDIGIIAPYLASSSLKFSKPGNKSQFKLLRDQNSIRMNDFLIKTVIPVTLFSKMLALLDTIKFFKRDGDLLETLTNSNFIVDHSNPQDQKYYVSLE